MSRSPERRRDGGFTLVEVMVSLGLMAVVSAAVLGMIVTGLRAAGTAKFASQAKGLIQAQTEAMRTMPYHVGRSAGEYVDVLDVYYTDMAGPAAAPVCRQAGTLSDPSQLWTGYVAAGGARCEYEPRTGPFYRKVFNPVQAPGLGAFAVVVDTQYLSLDTPPVPVAPPAGYDRRSATADVPASQQISVTVTVLYKAAQTRKAVSSYTQIADRLPAVPVVVSEASAQALRVSGAVAKDPVLLTLASLGQKGAVYTGSNVSTSANGAALSSGTSGAQTGAVLSRTAPGDVPLALAANGPPRTLPDLACFGTSRVEGLSAVTTGPPGQPGVLKAGSPAAPTTAYLNGNGSCGGAGFGFFFDGNRTDLSLVPDAPMASFDSADTTLMTTWQNCSPGVGGQDALALSTGYLDSSVSGSAKTTEACATSQARTVSLFPTSFAPGGVVRVRLSSAAVSCRTVVDAGVPTATATVSYSAQVWRFDGAGYVLAATVSPGNATDPLDGVSLSVPVGGGRTLGDYVSSWASLTGEQVSGGASKTARAQIPGVVTIDSQPLRPGDETSVMSVQVGALSCETTDLR